jgi:LysR family transcriptional activator of nhaA
VLELNYHHLYYFFSVVKAGSITNASADLLLSPPTISAQIKKFEKTVKRKLFEKKGQGLRLTPEGRVFFDYARQIFTLGDQLQDRIRDNTLAGVPAVQLGLTPGLPHSYCEAVIRFIRKKEPASPVTVVKDETDKLIPQLADRRVDFLLSTSPIRHLTAFHLENVLAGSSDLILVADAKRFGTRLKPKLLKTLPFIVAGLPKQTAENVKNYLELINAQSLCEVTDRDDALRLAAAGHGVTMVDEYAFVTSPYRRGMKSIPSPAELNLSESLYITYIPRKLKNPLAEKIIASFRID